VSSISTGSLSESAPPSSGFRAFARRLRRHTSSGLYIAELDGLRFVAVISVFLYHLGGDVERHSLPGAAPVSLLFRLTNELNIGVPLFFAISGMILGLPFARYRMLAGPRVSLKRYYLRRLTRLEPPYVLSLLLLFLFKLISHRGTFEEQLPHLGASLVYLHNAIYRDMSSINPVAWSLEVEVQFYVLAPLLGTVFAIRMPWLRRSLLSAAILIAAFVTPWPAQTEARQNAAAWMNHLSLTGNIQYFLAGFLLADFYLMKPPAAGRDRKWDLVTIAGWPLLAILLIKAPGVVYAGLPAFLLALYAAVFYGPASRRFFANIWFASIGGMCYSIYLLHNYLIAVLGFVTERVGQAFSFDVHFVIQAVLMAPIVLGCSILFYLAIEQPCMRSDWPQRLRKSAADLRGRFASFVGAHT